MEKNNRIARSFIVQIADLVFHVEPNQLTITDGISAVKSDINVEEINILEAFCAQAKTVLSPLNNSEIIYSIDDGPQKISLIKKGENYILVINTQIQFTTQSEEIYHEALVHPAVASLNRTPEKFLILGGGDGLAAKQIFKHYPSAQVDLVDFDKNITDIFTYDPVMREFNQESMSKCRVINEDAFEWVKSCKNKYDIIICDFPDPDDEIFVKLYSKEIYENIKNLLEEGGAICVQSGSLIEDSKSFKCIEKTLQSVGFKTLTYNTPASYGELAYTVAKLEDIEIKIPNGLKTMTNEYFHKAMRSIRPDLISNVEVEINTLENGIILSYRKDEIEAARK